jgi:hypothetical protein
MRAAIGYLAIGAALSYIGHHAITGGQVFILLMGGIVLVVTGQRRTENVLYRETKR